MYLKRKIDELKTFFAHTQCISALDLEILSIYIDKWGQDLRTELGLASQPDATIGITLDDNMQLTKVPDGLSVKEGMYSNADGDVLVEVTGQDPISGNVLLEVIDKDDDQIKLESMSSRLFVQLFKSTNWKL